MRGMTALPTVVPALTSPIAMGRYLRKDRPTRLYTYIVFMEVKIPALIPTNTIKCQGDVAEEKKICSYMIREDLYENNNNNNNNMITRRRRREEGEDDKKKKKKKEKMMTKRRRRRR